MNPGDEITTAEVLPPASLARRTMAVKGRLGRGGRRSQRIAWGLIALFIVLLVVILAAPQLLTSASPIRWPPTPRRP
jgi:hypothetical protein